MDAPIFISFASNDLKVAETICTAVEHRGLPCWISTRDIGPGDNFQEAITRAIRGAKVMILVFSAHANNSLEVKKEIALAGRYNVVVVPVRVEDVVPNDAFSYEFAVRQWIDMFDDWERAIERLVAQLSAAVRADSEAPASLAAASSEMPASAAAASANAPPAPPQPAPARPESASPASPRWRYAAAFLAGVVVLGVAIAAVLYARTRQSPSMAMPSAMSTPMHRPTSAPRVASASPPIPAAPKQPTPAAPPQPAPAAAAQPTPTPAAPGPKSTTPPARTVAVVAPPATPSATPKPGAPAPPAALPPGQSFRDCPDCPEMMVLPSGRFTMGAGAEEQARYGMPPGVAEHERPRHEVTIAKPFALAKFDITRGEFAAFAKATGFHPHPGCQRLREGRWVGSEMLGWENPGYPQTARDPVVCMNGFEIDAYVRWLRHKTGRPYRLPSESEWEYAARGGTGSVYYWGNDAREVCQYENIGDRAFAEWRRRQFAEERGGGRDDGPVRNLLRGRVRTLLEERGRRFAGAAGGPAAFPCRDGFAATAPVGSFKPNPFGLYDMLGNVSVLTADCWHPDYVGAPSDGSAWNSGNCGERVVRKGSFLSARPLGFAAAARYPLGFGAKHFQIGFRVALTLP